MTYDVIFVRYFDRKCHQRPGQKKATRQTAGGFLGHAGGHLRPLPEEESLFPAFPREELPEEEELLLFPLLPESEERVATLVLPEDSPEEEERVETLAGELLAEDSCLTVEVARGACSVRVRGAE